MFWQWVGKMDGEFSVSVENAWFLLLVSKTLSMKTSTYSHLLPVPLTPKHFRFQDIFMYGVKSLVSRFSGLF